MRLNPLRQCRLILAHRWRQCLHSLLGWNSFGGASGTYGATGNAAKIPTTVGIAGNYQDGALIART